MAESASHVLLVEELVQWIAKVYLNGDRGSLLIDHRDSSACCKPPSLNGFIPDVYTASTPNGLTIIGEAKTAHDVERLHSEAQIKAFLRFASLQDKAVFVFAAPWPISKFSKALIKRLQQETGADYVTVNVLDGLPG
jgi:hypothetical protein